MALSAYDQAVYDAGYKYIPQSQYLLNPFQIPTTQAAAPTISGGLTTIPVSMGGGSGSALQARDISYDDFSKAGFDAYANRQPTPLIDGLYQSKLDKTFMGFPSYRQQDLTGPDMGEYIGSGTDIPLELTGAGRIQSGLERFGGGISSLAERIGGLGPVSAVLGAVDKFDTLPELDKQFIEQSMGYRGPTVFGENTGGGYVDPFGVNVRSAFGNYAEKVRSDFSSLEDSLTGRLSEKYGARFNPATGLFESDDEEAAALANKNTAMMRKKYLFRRNQVKQQAFDEEIAAKKAAAAKAAEEKLQREADEFRRKQQAKIKFDKEKARKNIVADTKAGAFKNTVQQDRGGGGSWRGQTAAKERQGVSVAGPGFGKGAYFMNGGLVDLVDIYD